MNVTTSRTLTAVAAGLVIAGGAAACGPAAIHTTPPAHPAASAPPAVPAATTGPANTGPAGTTFTVTSSDGTSSYSVTLIAVEQHAQPANSYDDPGAGTHLAGAEFRITGVIGLSTDDANSDAIGIGTDHQVENWAVQDIAAGTNFSSGSWTVQAGQVIDGWVAYTVPDGMNLAAVQWTPPFSSVSGTWTLGS